MRGRTHWNDDSDRLGCEGSDVSRIMIGEDIHTYPWSGCSTLPFMPKASMTSLAGSIACLSGIEVAYGPSAGSSAPSKLRYLITRGSQRADKQTMVNRTYHLSSGGVSRMPHARSTSRTGTPRQIAVDTPEADQLNPTVLLTMLTSFLRSGTRQSQLLAPSRIDAYCRRIPWSPRSREF